MTPGELRIGRARPGDAAVLTSIALVQTGAVPADMEGEPRVLPVFERAL